MTDIVPVEAVPTDSFEEPREDAPATGKWYLVDQEGKEKPYFGCITHVGSNYYLFSYVGGSTERIPFEEYWKRCHYVLDPDKIINDKVEGYQADVKSLLSQVHEITRSLGVAPPAPGLPQVTETQALAVYTGQHADAYKAALVKAEKEKLPQLFTMIRDANQQLGKWLKARLIPLEAEAEKLDDSIGIIKERLFSVELYAGLIEQVEQIADGNPAPSDTKIHLMQRMAFMDEECLANYRIGGMRFEELSEFEKWLTLPVNRDRILPFPRTIVAFRVRREKAQYRSFSDFVKMLFGKDMDMKTFLYMRNGDQIFRLSTGIEFDKKLFPDLEGQILDRGELWAKMFAGNIKEIVSDNEYQELEKDHLYQYEKFSPESVYYDDIANHIRAEMSKHNKLVLVLQGILDRSSVFHPHPVWQLWSGAGFGQALKLIYDQDRVLTSGDAPDFEEYRAKLNKSLKVGSVTIGQEEVWVDEETKRRSSEDRDYYSYFKVSPSNSNPGPGRLAIVQKMRAGKCTYVWNRRHERASYGNDQQVRDSMEVSVEDVLNVDAYTPGDYKLFFNDPRTRADYLEWAPMLLEAEEYHAGNKKPVEVPEKPKKPPTSEESREKYERQKELKNFKKKYLEQAVRLNRDVTMKSGTIFKKNSLWRVYDTHGTELKLRNCNGDGTPCKDSHYINGLNSGYVDIDVNVPPNLKEPRL